MKLVVVSASLKSDKFYSTGCILINANGTGGKGIFASDNIELSIKDDHLCLRLCEKTFDDEDIETYRFSDDVITNYVSKFEGNSLYIPEKYYLYNKKSELLVLSLNSLVNNDNKIARFLEDLATLSHH